MPFQNVQWDAPFGVQDQALTANSAAPSTPWVKCTKCQEIKPREEFPRNKNRVSGLNSWCTPCNNNRNKNGAPTSSRTMRPASMPSQHTHCVSCERPASACVFPISKHAQGQRSKRSSWCLECHEAFRKTLSPAQAKAEALRWRLPAEKKSGSR